MITKTATNPTWFRRISRAVGLLLITMLMSLALIACGSETNNGTTRSLITPDAGATTAAATSASTTSSASTTAALNTTVAASTTAAAPTSANRGATTTAATTAAATTTTTQRAAGASAPLTDQAESNTVVGVVKQLNPAVVTVYNKSKYTPGQGARTQANPNPTPAADGGLRLQGIGSGVIISSDGYIVTNEHVIDGQDDLTVALNDGKTVVPAKLVGKDRLGDIAVLKIDTKVPAFAKWADKTEVGETVVAIGSALGNFRNSVSKGVVSGVNRTLPGDTSSNVYVQTDTAINSGNSGGPLLNLRGEIVGINTAVLRSTAPGRVQRGGADVAEGLGFAIPSNIAKVLVDQIISKGSVTRPYFGITYQMITPAEAGTVVAGGRTAPNVEGAWVSRSSGSQPSVVRGGPADKAGLQDNDIITAIDGQPLNDNNPLMSVVLKYQPGQVVKLTVQRGDQTLTVSLTLGERPADL